MIKDCWTCLFLYKKAHFEFFPVLEYKGRRRWDVSGLLTCQSPAAVRELLRVGPKFLTFLSSADIYMENDLT